MFGPKRLAVEYEMPLFVPMASQVEAHDLIESGQFTRAAWRLWRRAQLGPFDAVKAARILRSGEVLPDFPMPWKLELATRVAELLNSNRRKEAVFLVRSEQSLSTADAETYVDKIQLPTTVTPPRRDDSSWPKSAVPLSALIVVGALACGIYLVSKSQRPVLMALCVLTGALIGASILVHGIRKWLAGEPIPGHLAGISTLIALAVGVITMITGASGAGGALATGLASGMFAANIWAVLSARANRQP